TAWVTVLATSLLGCLFIRCTAAAPGLYPSRGLRGALLMYRMHMMNRIQRQWTWTITGQYLRALAGMRFPRWGGSECDLMFNLVPEVAIADPQVPWLLYEHARLRRRTPYAAPARHASEFLHRQQQRGRVRATTVQLP